MCIRDRTLPFPPHPAGQRQPACRPPRLFFPPWPARWPGCARPPRCMPPRFGRARGYTRALRPRPAVYKRQVFSKAAAFHCKHRNRGCFCMPIICNPYISCLLYTSPGPLEPVGGANSAPAHCQGGCAMAGRRGNHVCARLSGRHAGILPF